MYFLIKRVLFLFEPEKVHYFVLNLLKRLLKIKIIYNGVWNTFHVKNAKQGINLWGLDFPNRVGLAAGFDKDAENTKEMAALGFGFIEIGTLTPLGQAGNPKPRLFRIPKQKSLINRMGFNNKGVEKAIEALKKITDRDYIIGGNIGKNKDTPNEDAWKDYLSVWEALYPYVDYFVVNVSSPNTPNLRALQEKEPLRKILAVLKEASLTKNKNKPILLKISPDLNSSQLDDIIEIILDLHLDGMVATNTTLNRDALPANEIYRNESGGLSGKPLASPSNEIIRYIKEKSQGKFPIIGVGGVLCAQDAIDKIEAGASLVQIYTGFIYEGPQLIKSINKLLVNQATG